MTTTTPEIAAILDSPEYAAMEAMPTICDVEKCEDVVYTKRKTGRVYTKCLTHKREASAAWRAAAWGQGNAERDARYAEFAALYRAAADAADAAGKACRKRGSDGVAIVVVPNGGQSFAYWAKREMPNAFGWARVASGMAFPVPAHGGSLDKSYAWGEAFARVLTDGGIPAQVYARFAPNSDDVVIMGMGSGILADTDVSDDEVDA